MGLPAERRLRKPSEFENVLRSGKKAGDHLLLMSAMRTNMTSSRFGLAASKRLGSAVTRNQVKRRLREILRQLETEEGGGSWDVVVSARPSAAQATYAELKGSVQKLMKRLGIGSAPPAARLH